MKILVAPLHYTVNTTSGSEYTRALEYIKAIAADQNFSGDVIVGHTDITKLGQFKFHNVFGKDPRPISVVTRLKFIAAVYLKARKLMKNESYDYIWHVGPFGINETFNIAAITNKNTKFVVGPVYTPFVEFFKGGLSSNNIKTIPGATNKKGIYSKIDTNVYTKFSRIFMPLSIKTMKKAKVVVTVDAEGKKMVEQAGGKAMLLPIGVDTSTMQSKPRKLRNGKVRLLNVSYLLERKRTIDLLYAVYHLINKYGQKEFTLTIIGDGPLRSQLESLAKQLKISKYVKFLGYCPRDQIGNFYKSADIFLSASVMDTMPGMYYEAMSAALPMIIARNGSAAKLESDKFGGFVVEQNNPEMIAKYINVLLSNPKKYNELSKRNYELSQKQYNFTKLSNELKGIFTN